MSEARGDARVGNVTVAASGTSVAVSFDSPLSDAAYEVALQLLQSGTYDIWATTLAATGFTVNIFPAAISDLRISYAATERSDSSGAAFVQSLSPAAWFRYGLGITSGGGLVSQWADQSGNARHLNQPTGTNQPTLQGDSSILFDAVDDYMTCDPFTLNQPTTVYIAFSIATWANNHYVFDGATLNKGRLIQSDSTPQAQIYAGGVDAIRSSHLPIGEYAVAACVFNGPNSIFHINNTPPMNSTDIGANNMGGFTLGVGGGPEPTTYSDISVKEIIIYAEGHDELTRATIIRYLAGVSGISL
jgi:hypothetical protein